MNKYPTVTDMIEEHLLQSPRSMLLAFIQPVECLPCVLHYVRGLINVMEIHSNLSYTSGLKIEDTEEEHECEFRTMRSSLLGVSYTSTALYPIG